MQRQAGLLSQFVKEVGPAFLGCRRASARRWDLASQRAPRRLKGTGRLKACPTSSMNFSSRRLEAEKILNAARLRKNLMSRGCEQVMV